jgi:hypothetical protein
VKAERELWKERETCGKRETCGRQDDVKNGPYFLSQRMGVKFLEKGQLEEFTIQKK